MEREFVFLMLRGRGRMVIMDANSLKFSHLQITPERVFNLNSCDGLMLEQIS